MWRKLAFHNFKSLRSVELTLDRLTVLVGPNGAGKSSILFGAELLAQLATNTPEGGDAAGIIRHRYRAGGPLSVDKLRTSGVTDDESIVLRAVIEPGAFGQPRDDFELRLRPATASDADRTAWIDLAFNGTQGPLTRERKVQGENGGTAARELARVGHGPAMTLALNGASLARPSYLDDEAGRMQPDGYGLPSALANMAATDRERMAALESALRRIVPRARRIRTPAAKVSRRETQIITVSGQEHAVQTPRELMGHRLEVEMEGAGFLDASLLSEGTLIALGILTLVHSETSPKLVLIDDLDHSLHPSAHKELVQSLRRVLEERPELQIVTTTHAPYLLDHFEASEVRVLSLDENGHTSACKLLEHPEWTKAEGALSTGEFWSTVGEGWVTANAEE